MPIPYDFSLASNEQLADTVEAYAANRRALVKDDADALLFEVRNRLRATATSDSVHDWEAPARFAHVKSNSSARSIEQYLYANYRVVQLGDSVFIVGQDNAGFTLDALIDRLHSGLHTAIEISAEDYAHAYVVGGFPKEGITRCICGAKYWEGLSCHSCGTKYDGKDYTEEVRTV